jgi:energy-coupling factor transporter ATP-binding protein EcfA2
MNITKVRSNVKAGCDLQIGSKTIVVGPNGSGKSTIVNAVELALTSRVGDIAGRTDIAREADVMQLAPKDTTAIIAEVIFDNGDSAHYRVEGSTAKAKKHVANRPVTVQHDDVLPIRTLKDALLGSPTTARKFLIGKVCGSTTRSDIENLLPEVVRETWRAASSTVPESIPAPDALVEVLEYAGKQQRDANSSAKTQREAGKLVGGGRMSPPSEAEVAAAKKARDDAKKVEREAEDAANHSLQASTQRDTVENLTRKLANAEERTKKAREALSALGKPVTIHPVLDSVIATMDISLIDGVCYTCDGPAPTKELVEATKSAVSEQRAKNTQHDAADRELQTAVIEESNLRNLLDGSTRLLNDLLTETYTGPTVEEARAACDKAEEALLNLRGARDAWNSVQKAESVALDCERRAGEWKALKEACEAAVGSVLDTARAAFVAKVQSKLPSSDTFALNLRDGEREVVQFGLVRDGKLHTALSGAEWARVTAAMAESCVEPGKYACIIPEERAFDEVTLFEVLKALGTSEHQVIITSPVHPAAIPEGWTLIKR